MSYIEQEALIKFIDERAAGLGITVANCCNFKDIVKMIPAADVAEVKHGFWFISEYEYLNCSVCGESYFTGADSTAEAKERLAEGNYYPYCPHCGAKMDAEPPQKKGKRK